MVSVVAPRSSFPSLDQALHVQRDCPVLFTELGPPSDAVEPFKQLVLRSHTTDLRLYCTVPTWSSSSDNCLDLHDLHQLRAKFLVLIHDIVHALRSSGVTASYVLVPSNSSRCILCAGGCDDLASAIALLQKTPLEPKHQQNVLLADIGCPCLIIT
ncbi:hypothetical protein DFH07DRAFT_789098 [Mycena maculata]|uniref:Uncharacterized protein n=1 Tax=Mycena maculata TaxID=230809 RepID=A0AAD7P1G2_9AGAR|nr:hypothetical protein DFH07DRAFT_789098 [Mycena maculata]